MLASDLSGNLKSLKTSFDFFKLKCNKLEKEMKEKQGEIRYMKGYEKEKSGDMGFKMHVIIFIIYLEKTINLKKFR